MATSPSAPTRPRPAAGRTTAELKVLITAAALASTLGGWAALAHQEDRPRALAAPPLSAPPVDQAAAALGPLPPLESLVTLSRLPTPGPLPTARAADPAGAPASAPAAQARDSAASAPGAARPGRPAPPRPVAVTRSSR